MFNIQIKLLFILFNLDQNYDNENHLHYQHPPTAFSKKKKKIPTNYSLWL